MAANDYNKLLRRRSFSIVKSQLKNVKKKQKKAVIDILEGFKDWKFNVGARGEKIKFFFLISRFFQHKFSSFSFCVHENGRKEILEKLSYFFFLAPATEALS